MGKTVWLRARITILIGVSLSPAITVLSAQSGNNTGAGPTLGLIILIEPKEEKGALKVRQGKRVRPINAVEGMLIRKGYMLTLRDGARATVICGDGKKRELLPGPQGCPCTAPCTPEICGIRYDGSTIGRTRGPDTQRGAFPVVISPRKTMLLNPRPTIRWAPIAGAKENTIYKVTIYGEGMKEIWTRVVGSETTLNYPENEPPLTPGQTYKVVVTSDGLSSEQDHSPGLGFTTLTTDQARALAGEEINRKELGLPDTQTRFLLANLFAARELYSEAIEQLEALYATMKESAVVRMLGDLYAAIGLNREAEKNYLRALAATAADNMESIGATNHNLSQVYESLGTNDLAIARLEKAMRVYRRLGNKAVVSALLRDRRRLKTRRSRL